MNINEKINIIKEQTIEIIDIEELKNKLNNNNELNVKIGLDPTNPDLHLGHFVLLNKAKQLQDKLNFKIDIIIGDFTALIGDPTGKNKTRPKLTIKEINHNCLTYEKQILNILDKKKTNILYNSTWLKKIDLNEIINILSNITISQILERKDFKNRYNNDIAIYLHEIIYPLIQGYDSMILNSDIEMGGVDQKFNLIKGREIQKIYNKQPQIIITMPLLIGTNGLKMSKSSNNYIKLTEDPNKIFGKIMSITDEIMEEYNNIFNIKNKDKEPIKRKMNLAEKIIDLLYSKKEALNSKRIFITQFIEKKIPSNIKNYKLIINSNTKLYTILKNINIINSTSNAIRLINQKAIKINNNIVKNKDMNIDKSKFITIRVGKKYIFNINILRQVENNK